MEDQANHLFVDGNQQSNELYHAVIIPDSGERPFVISKLTANLLAAELKNLYGKRVYAFPFKGRRWAISKGPTQRYLLGPDGERISLFPNEPTHEPDPVGSLYIREETLQEKFNR